eukprot:CAMPEP_0171821008 /NCGR_PEP_ID=MMETSP0992-20121227/3084_1 /TAXON_ID=483369 /ORGANISM="non described non described, Strain CCMP2098" /LENGTH=367 /DNA_ID=CAMNT_0012435463 /DNA_START=72 /DNA_END=1176 /DNA_ORIENTATION=+
MAKLTTTKAPAALFLLLSNRGIEAFHTHRLFMNRRPPNVALGASSSETTLDVYKSRPDTDDGYGPLDFGVTDSLAVPDDARPTLLEASSNPRDALAVLLLGCGCAVGVHNVLGMYGPSYALAQGLSVALGFLNALALVPDCGAAKDGHRRRRCADGLRRALLCSRQLARAEDLDDLPALARFRGHRASVGRRGGICLLVGGAVVTLYEHFDAGGAGGGDGAGRLSETMVRASRVLAPLPQDQVVPSQLSDTELFRVKGLVFIGVLGCVFAPACLAFAFNGGQEWWGRVCELHPKQRLLESTDALFALFATEASMTCTRAASAGVAPYRKAVPVFAAVCFVLALVPCACSLWWLGGNNDISFFSFYTE